MHPENYGVWVSGYIVNVENKGWLMNGKATLTKSGDSYTLTLNGADTSYVWKDEGSGQIGYLSEYGWNYSSANDYLAYTYIDGEYTYMEAQHCSIAAMVPLTIDVKEDTTLIPAKTAQFGICGLDLTITSSTGSALIIDSSNSYLTRNGNSATNAAIYGYNLKFTGNVAVIARSGLCKYYNNFDGTSWDRSCGILSANFYATDSVAVKAESHDCSTMRTIAIRIYESTKNSNNSFVTDGNAKIYAYGGNATGDKNSSNGISIDDIKGEVSITGNSKIYAYSGTSTWYSVGYDSDVSTLIDSNATLYAYGKYGEMFEAGMMNSETLTVKGTLVSNSLDAGSSASRGLYAYYMVVDGGSVTAIAADAESSSIGLSIENTLTIKSTTINDPFIYAKGANAERSYGFKNYYDTTASKITITAPVNAIELIGNTACMENQSITNNVNSNTIRVGNSTTTTPTSKWNGTEYLNTYKHLYIDAKITSYKVVYNTNGGSMSDDSQFYVADGSTIGTLPIPTRNLYRFNGWKNAKGEFVDSTYVITENTELVADWTRIWTLSFDANGGSATKSFIQVYDGEEAGTLPTASYFGYTFTGWYTAKLGGTKLTSDSIITSDGSYYAHWEEETNEYKVTFDANGGKISGIASFNVTKGSMLSYIPDASKDGYTFMGWFTASTGGTLVHAATVPTSNVTYYAQWEKTVTEYKITFNANGGSITGQTNVTVNKGSAIGTLPTATKSGYTFNGWFTAASGGTKISTTTIPTADSTYYAQWTNNTPVVVGDKGDVNFDGKVNAQDDNVLTLIILGKYATTDKIMEQGDLNGDGKITAIDQSMLKQLIVG